MSPSPSKPSFSRLLCWAFLLIGAVCAALLLARRAQAELRSNKTACAFFYADVLALSETDGRTPSQWLKSLQSAGVAYLIVTEDDAPTSVEEAQHTGLRLARAGSAAQPGDAFLIPRLSGDALASGALMPDALVPLAIPEDLARTGVLLPDGIYADYLPGPTVRTLYSFERYRSSDDYGGILFRAAAERGMRLLVLRPMTDAAGAPIADPSAYAQLLSELRARLEQRGLTLGAEFSPLDAPQTDRILLAGALLATAALAVFLLGALVPLSGLLRCLLLFAAAAVLAGAAYLRPERFMPLGAFGAALLCGCFAALLLQRLWLSHISAEAPLFLLCLRALSGLLFLGVLGGLYVSALLSCRAYMLGFTVFRGVKAAQFLPLLFAAVLLAVTILRDPDARFPKGRRLTTAICICAVLAAAAILLLLLRSGDAGAFVSVWETRARDWLERVLYVRPRTKEMLLAYPCAALFAFSCKRKLPLLGILSGTLAAVASVSVINSFCHIVTPLHVTVIRSLLGAVIGCAVGAILLGVLSLCIPQRRKRD